jgi:hypothetical protein
MEETLTKKKGIDPCTEAGTAKLLAGANDPKSANKQWIGLSELLDRRDSTFHG